MENYADRLQARGIRPTAVRELILKAMLDYPSAFSMTDLEGVLDTVDKSTLSRTIRLFHEQKLIHSIDDGSGSVKYSVCHDGCNCDLGELHVHFCCQRCGHTYCLESIPIPEVRLPEGFVLRDANYVMKGLCDRCSQL